MGFGKISSCVECEAVSDRADVDRQARMFVHEQQSEKFPDPGTLTWRGADLVDLWVQWCLHAISRDFEVGKSWSYIWLNAGLATKVRV